MTPTTQDWVLTTPNMDRFGELVAFLFRGCGCEFVVPPPPTARTGALGRTLGREGFCQPLNNCLADLFNGLEAGATAAIVTQGEDACRYGFYWVNQKAILEEHFGREIPFFILNHQDPVGSVEQILTTVGVVPSRERIDYLWLQLETKTRGMRKLNVLANEVRPKERHPGATSGIYQRACDAVMTAEGLTDIKRATRDGLGALEAIETSERETLRVLLVGPIYEVLEVEANYGIEEYLAALGIVLERSLDYHDLVPFLGPDGQREQAGYERMLTGYAARHIDPRIADLGYGGYGRLTVAHAARAREFGFDGVIHVHSFSCMPEIVAKPFLRQIARADDIPTISLVVEEVSTREQFCNRLEAFVDLLRERHRATTRDHRKGGGQEAG